MQEDSEGSGNLNHLLAHPYTCGYGGTRNAYTRSYMNKGTLLVLGARHNSLGDYVAMEAVDRDWRVQTAGIPVRGELYENVECDITQPGHVVKLLSAERFDSVVCTVGINPLVHGVERLWDDKCKEVFDVNYHGPMNFLRMWLAQGNRGRAALWGTRHFVAISSNSAHIARSPSVDYCASKAALSMGIRSMARRHAKEGVAIYAYEPGWLNGTPMSDAIMDAFGDDEDLHRIPHGNGIPPQTLAAMIVRNLETGMVLNGCCLRVDGGEQ